MRKAALGALIPVVGVTLWLTLNPATIAGGS